MNHVPLGEVNAEEWVGGAFENESCHKEKGTDFF